MGPVATDKPADQAPAPEIKPPELIPTLKAIHGYITALDFRENKRLNTDSAMATAHCHMASKLSSLAVTPADQKNWCILETSYTFAYLHHDGTAQGSCSLLFEIINELAGKVVEDHGAELQRMGEMSLLVEFMRLASLRCWAHN